MLTNLCSDHNISFFYSITKEIDHDEYSVNLFGISLDSQDVNSFKDQFEMQ